MLPFINVPTTRTPKLDIIGANSELSLNKTFAVTDWDAVLASPGFGDLANRGITGMCYFDGYFYACTYRYTAGYGGEVWRTNDFVTWNQVNSDGFGTVDNRHLWGLKKWRGYLYCWSRNLVSGAEIWRTKVGSQQSDWAQCNTSGFGDATYIYIADMCEFMGELYATIYGIGVAYGKVYKTKDGITWVQANTDGGNFGLISGIPSTAITTFNGYLYIGSCTTGSKSKVYRSPDGANWESVCDDGFGDAGNLCIGGHGLKEFNSYLYANNVNNTTGVEVWRTKVGSQQSDWEQCNVDGFGDADRGDPNGPCIYNGYMYTGTSSKTGSNPKARVVRSSDGTTWTQCNVDGFGSASFVDNEFFSSYVYDGRLYLGMSSTNGDLYGCQIYRLNTGRTKNETGSLIAQGISVAPVRIEHGDIHGVNNLIADHIIGKSMGVSGVASVGLLILAPAPTQAITAVSDTITVAGSLLTLNPDANYTLTSTPTIPNGAIGQMLRIQVANGEANTVTLQDQNLLGSSNLRLKTSLRTILAANPIDLYFDGSDWVEVGGDMGGYTSVSNQSVTVTTAGTPVQPSSVACGMVFISPRVGNTGNIYVGASDVDALSDPPIGLTIAPGDPPVPMFVSDPNILYIDAAISTEGANIVVLS
jgi:hypothetical protein